MNVRDAEVPSNLDVTWDGSFAPTPFQTPEWLVHQWDGSRLPIRLGDGAFASLTRFQKNGTTWLCLAGADYRDIVCRPGNEVEAVRGLIAAMEDERWTVADFKSLHPEGRLAAGIQAGALEGVPHLLVPHQTYRYVRLPSNWAEYEKHIGQKLAYKIRAAKGRRDRHLGPNELRRATAETLTADLAALFDLHQRRMEHKDARGLFSTDHERDAFSASSRGLLETGRLWFYTLWANGQAISALYSLVDDKRVYFYTCGFDVDFQKHHPVKVLIAQAIQDGISAGLEEFDFMKGTEAYKSDWSNAERQTLRLIAWKGTIGWAQSQVLAASCRMKTP